MLLFSNFKALNSLGKFELNKNSNINIDIDTYTNTNSLYLSQNSYINPNNNLNNNFTNDLFGMNLSIYDSSFILPFIIIGCNYIFLRYSCHPFLINYQMKKPIKIFYLSFFISLISIILPKVN